MSDFENKNKAKSTFDPNTAKPIDTPLVAKSDGFNFDPSTAKEEKKGVLGHLKDTGASLMSGLAGAAEATTVGLADLYTEGRVGKDIDHSGYYKLGEAQKHWSDQKTEIAKEQEKTRQNTDGIWNKTKYVLENPSQLTNTVAESLPYMLGGAVLGRASKIANPIVAGAVGEGAVMAGSQAESIRQQSDDELLNNGQEAVAAGTGVLGGLFGYAGGRLAQKLGIGDVDTMLMTGRVGAAEIASEIASMPAKSLPRRVVEGAISEGFLEELPQSISEQILQNLALDKPWHDGVEDAAVMGTLAGMAMGAGGNILSGHQAENTSATTEPSLNSSYLPAVSTASDPLSGEYIPRADVQDKAPQVQSAFVYDQQSTDADNRLNFNIPPHPDAPRSGFDDPINPNTPPTPNGQYFDIPQLRSEKMGLNPNDGPMSSAAALAVDSGASPIAQLGYTEQQNTSNNTAPVDFQAQHESKVKNLYAQGMGENITLKNGEQVRLIQTADDEGAYNLNAVNQDGEIVGSLGYFTVEDENGNRFNPQLHVDEQHRRNGIATAMYDYAEANGAKIPELDATAGVLRTEQGQAFREARHARQNGIEPKQKDVPEFNIDQKLENVDYSIDWHKENIELATNEYDKKRSQDAIKELQEERHDLVQKKDANLILGADGQNKWFGSQAKADAFIAKKELSNTHHVVQTENKRFEIQPIITEIQDHNLAANTSNQKGFQMEALDHGVLNVPLSKRGDIDQQIDQYKKEQAVIEKDQRDLRKIDHQKAQTVAKSLFNHLSKQHIEYYADRAKITVNAATKELKSMAHWQPNKAIKIYNALKEVQQKSQSELSVPSEITELEQQFNAIKGNSVKQAIEKSKIKKQIDQLKSQHTEISTNQFKEKENDRFTSRSKSQQQSRDRSDHLPTSDTRAKNSNGITAEASDGTSSARPNSDPRTQEDSTRTSQSDNSGSTTQQVHDVLVDRFGKDTINELERQGKLEIIQDYQVEGVEGFYHNGKAVLVASNLTAESIVPTFLHELGGHAGFQNMMNQKQYNELMRQFDKLVEQRHPVALAAKLLAEREQGFERQQLEYLPYLLTLSATMQQRNVIQRNALQKLINNIVSFVKAWVFDQFGINLNLKPDDMLALSERMIQKNSAAIQSKEQQNPSAVFSEKTKSVFTDAFTIAKDEQQRIAKEIDDLLSTLKSLPDPVKMKMPPVLLALDGVNGLSVQDLPLHLDRQTIRKMMGRVDGKQDAGHQLTLDQVKQLINEITNPVMVFKDGANGVVVITEMKDRQDNPVLSAIHLNKKWRGYEINDIATAFSKDSTPHIWFNKNQNNIVYLNQEKSQVFARSSSHQLRGAVQNILASNKSSKYPTLPHLLEQLETTHVGVVGNRTFDESPALVRQSPLQLRGVVHQNKASHQTILLPEDVVNFVEQSKSSLYSRQSPQKMMDDLAQNIKNMSVKSIKDKTGYKFTDWLGIGLSALGRRQLTEIYSKLLPQLNKYNELAAQMDADKNDAGAEADGIVREWANLKDENELADLMHDATLAKIDPAQPYVPGDNRIKYQQLRQNFNALSPEAQAMYIKARDAYRKHYAKVQSAIKDRILRAALSSQKKADLIKQMDDQFYGYIKGVYFPLARFGKYVVVVRNQNGDVESVSRAETMGEAQKIRSEMLKKFPQWKVEPVIQDKAFRSARDAVGRGFMSNLFDEVANLGLSSAEQASFEDTLNQLYLSSMPDLSWAKHGIHRKGTAGFSQDARRAFAQNMFSGANYLAKLRYGDQLADQLDAMQKHADDQIKQNHQYNQSTAQSVIDEMNKRHENLMNPKGHPLSSALTSLGFIYYLGLSPAAAMVNLSQTALVAYPLMGAKWDFDKAGKELLKASNDFRKGLEFHKVKWQGTKTDLYKAVSSDISKFLNKDEQAAYQKAVDSGVIDVTQAHDLAGIAQGEDSGVMWKTRPIMRAASVMFHSAERFNREVTFIAAYRLARQSGAHHDLAFDQAVDVTYKGHFDYSSGNRPRIMQGNVAKVLLLFKQFGQNMLYTLARQTYQSIKGETDAEKKEARRAISAILAMHATFAGALGLPGVWFIMAIASAWGGDDDEPWDAEIALRNYLAEAFNPTISNLLMKGAPRGVGIDVSSRVGINNLLLPDVQEGLEGKRWAESAMAGALGPVAGMGTNLIKGSQEISEGHNLRGIETMLPVFLKNFAKTYRYADEGVQDKTGISIMDEVSSMDLLVQSMGFSPSDVRTANEGKSAIYQFNRKLNERRSRLMTLWSRAKMMDDQQEMDEVWKEIQGFNDKNPSRRITRINLNQSYRNRQRRIDRAEDGIYLSRNRQDARAAGYFAFGE